MAEQPLVINIQTWHHCAGPDGSSYMLYEEQQGLGIYRFEPSGEAPAAEQWHLSTDEYEQFRQARPELALPPYKPRAPGTNANGNTLGKVVGPSAAASVPAAEANPSVSPETAAEADTGNQVLDGLQLGLDVVGLVPGFGEIADLANAGISAARGDWLGASLSLAAAIPFAGWFATVGKVAKRGANLAEVAAKASAKTAKNAAKKGAKEIAEHADEVAEQVANAAKGGKIKGPRQASLREQYLGRTPGKNSRTGREVQERMRAEGKLRDGPDGREFKASDGEWYSIRDADMSHNTDAVTWWNKTGRNYGPKSPEAREWMLDPDNYRLDHYSINRSAGARLPDRYLPPIE